jgi:hypothetical protein
VTSNSVTLERSHDGRNSIAIVSSHQANKWGASQYVYLNQTEPKPILLSGWSAAETVSGKPDDGYSIYMDVQLKDGSYSYANTLQFETGTHGWQRLCMVLDFENKLIESVHVFVLFSEHSGSIWFDELTLLELSSIFPN